MSETSEIAGAERRQAARLAYYDSTAQTGATEGSAIALDKAIETATRVKITTDIINEYTHGWYAAPREAGREYPDRRRAGLIAAFRAAGFEVED